MTSSTRARQAAPRFANGEQPAALVQETLRRADEAEVRFVNLQFTDLTGIVKSVTIPIHQLEDAATNGKWFDGSSIEGFARIAESDMFLVPDLKTWAIMPWEIDEESTALIGIDVLARVRQVGEFGEGRA